MNEISDNEIASKLRIIITRLVKVIKTEVNSDECLSLTERSTLSLICQNERILASELALKEKVSSQAMSQIINKLLLNNLILKMPSTEDKRKIFISVSAKGNEYLDSKRSKSQEWLAKSISEKLADSEKGTLLKAIEILTKFVD